MCAIFYPCIMPSLLVRRGIFLFKIKRMGQRSMSCIKVSQCSSLAGESNWEIIKGKNWESLLVLAYLGTDSFVSWSVQMSSDWSRYLHLGHIKRQQKGRTHAGKIHYTFVLFNCYFFHWREKRCVVQLCRIRETKSGINASCILSQCREDFD